LRRILYFHGFASSPHSRKIARFRELLPPDEFVIDTPDLNVPSFERLDFEAMVDLGVARGRAAPPDALVGSSLGSLVALTVARRMWDGFSTRPPPEGRPLGGRGRVENPSHIVLIAPPLGMAAQWISHVPAGDPVSVFNHARNANAPIHRAFFEQMARVDVDRLPPAQPVTVIIGRHDETVPFDGVRERWREWEASGRLAEGSRFVEIPEGDHGLVAFAESIAEVIRRVTTPPSAARSRGESQ
jgi:pimeloyl-ACP methyl ester carboxylesterase